MPTLHLLPGEARGDSAEVVLNRQALRGLINLLQCADESGHAAGTFHQRDGSSYTLLINVLDRPHHDRAWRDVRLSYLHHHVRRVLVDTSGRPYDAELLAAHLYAARKAKSHNQTVAAALIGVSVAALSNTENCKTAPKPGNFTSICRYIGTTPDEYSLGEVSTTPG